MIVRILSLLRLKQRATLRQFVRSLRTPRRAIGLLVLTALIGFVVWSSWHAGGATSRGGLSRESLVLFGAMMLVMSLSSGFVQQGPRFTPADVDFLFPAPFSPRHLLVWRLLHVWPLMLISASFMLLVFGWRYERPGRFLVGIFLLQTTATHVQILISVVLTLASDALARRLRGVGRWITMAALVGGLLFVVLATSRNGGLGPIVASVTRSSATRLLLFPAAACGDFVFGETARATGFALLKLVLGAAGTLGLLLLPDVDFREESIATTARISRLLAARRRLGTAVDVEEVRRVRSGVLPAARLLFRGSGAIVWKNLLLAVRSWKSLVPSLAIGLIVVLPIVFATRKAGVDAARGALVPLLMVTLLLSNALGFDLRREVDRLDQLRALPLSPRSVVFAELIVPWVLGVTLQELLVATIALAGQGDRVGLSVVALAMPFLTFLAVEIDNLALFLFAPKTQAGAARGSLSSSSPGQMLRAFVWLIAAAPGIVAGLALYAATRSIGWSIAAGSAVEIAIAAALFVLLVRCYGSREVESGD